MLATKYRERPNCDVVLSQFNSWNITISEVKEDNNYDKNFNHLKQFSNKFFGNYFESKFK